MFQQFRLFKDIQYTHIFVSNTSFFLSQIKSKCRKSADEQAIDRMEIVESNRLRKLIRHERSVNR